MSVSGRSSPRDRIQTLLSAIEEVRPERGGDYQQRMHQYVQIAQQNELSLPEIAYTPQKGCLNVAGICNAVSCCFRSKCCSKETYNYYVSEVDEEGIKLKPKTSTRSPSVDDNKMTNASFFIDLYKEYGDFLPFLMNAVIEYLPSVELRSYWLSWDPSSSDHLDFQRARDFKRLLSEASRVYEQVRMEMMKKEMREKMGLFESSDQGVPSTRKASKKMLRKGDRVGEFDRSRVKNDLQKITICSELEAERAALEVERALPDVATTQDVWDVMSRVAHQHSFAVRPAFEGALAANLYEILEQTPAVKVIDIPPSGFAQLMRTSVIKKRAEPSDQRVQALVRNKFDLEKNSHHFEVMV